MKFWRHQEQARSATARLLLAFALAVALLVAAVHSGLVLAWLALYWMLGGSTGTDGQGFTNPFTNRGVVWDGNNPIHRDEFDQNYYRGPDDDELDGAINSVEEGNILMDNHSLIATDSEDNMKALEKMLRPVTR